ncbi:MAG: type II RES/Xre toxin-antitoxin system antitoxin [Dongiaceae bacterium]
MPSSSYPVRIKGGKQGEDALARVVKRLGGSQVWKKPPTTKLQVHEAIRKGLPGRALVFMAEHVTHIPSDTLFDIVGLSRRTMQRRADTPTKPLNQDQSGRLWKFAEILNTSTELFGDQESAERWLTSPAIALEQKSPADLMTTQPGAEIVEQLLTRLEHGVYT